MKNQFVIDVRFEKKRWFLQINIDARSYITSPQTDFEKDSTNGAEFATEDISATQIESWIAQKHYLEKSPSTLNSTSIADISAI